MRMADRDQSRSEAVPPLTEDELQALEILGIEYPKVEEVVAEVRRLRAWLEWVELMADPNERTVTNDWATAALAGQPPPQGDAPDA